MALQGNQRYIEFWIRDDNGDPVTNRDLSAIQVYLTRDTLACSDTVTLHNWGNTGRYYASYTPSAVGHDYLELIDSTYDLLVMDAEDVTVDDGSFATGSLSLTQDYGGVGKLKVTGVADPSQYAVYVFNSRDWQSGTRDIYASLSGSSVSADGSWDTPIPIIPGTFHVVAMRSAEDYFVIAAFLKVT